VVIKAIVEFFMLYIKDEMKKENNKEKLF